METLAEEILSLSARVETLEDRDMRYSLRELARALETKLCLEACGSRAHFRNTGLIKFSAWQKAGRSGELDRLVSPEARDTIVFVKKTAGALNGKICLAEGELESLFDPPVDAADEAGQKEVIGLMKKYLTVAV